MNSENKIHLNKMKSKIEQIDKLARELKDLGQGLPVIEKNVEQLVNTIFVLKFGIADVAEIDAV